MLLSVASAAVMSLAVTSDVGGPPPVDLTDLARRSISRPGLSPAPAPTPKSRVEQAPSAPLGLFYLKDFAAWLKSEAFEPHAMGEGVPRSLAFGPDGGVVIQAEGFVGLERICRMEARPSEGALVLQLVCDDLGPPVTRRWRWRSGDEAETDLFSETEGATDVVVRAKPTWDEREKAYADAFHRARLPALVGRYAAADGTVVEVDAKGLAHVGGQRVEACIVVECVSQDRPEHGQTGCLLLAPKNGVGRAGEWLIRPEGKALTLVRGMQAFETGKGVWPGGFDVIDGGQVLRRVR